MRINRRWHQPSVGIIHRDSFDEKIYIRTLDGTLRSIPKSENIASHHVGLITVFWHSRKDPLVVKRVDTTGRQGPLTERVCDEVWFHNFEVDGTPKHFDFKPMKMNDKRRKRLMLEDLEICDN